MQQMKAICSFSGQLKENNTKKGIDSKNMGYINGNIVIEDAQGGSHRVDVFEYIKKNSWDSKTSSMTFTEEDNPYYKGLETLATYGDAKSNPNNPIYVSSSSFKDYSSANISANDYYRDGRMFSGIKISNKVFKTVEPSKVDGLFHFNVSGIIEDKKLNEDSSIAIKFLVLTTKGGYNNSEVTLNNCFPMDLIVEKGLAEQFESAGYDVGMFVNFSGVIVNNTITTQENSYFGEAEVITKRVVQNQIKIGGRPMSIYDIGLTDNDIEMVKNKRELYLKKIEERASNIMPTQINNSQQNMFSQTPNINFGNGFNNNSFNGQTQQTQQQSQSASISMPFSVDEVNPFEA